MKSLIVLLVILALGGGGVWWYMHHRTGPTVTYRTAPVKRGELLATIGSTGTVEPEEVVDVGAQVQGIIDRFGKDTNGHMIDWRSPVTEGMELAHIDDSLYVADLNNANASLDQIKATLQYDTAELDDLRAKVVLGKNEWARAQKFANTHAIADNDLDQYQYNYDSARAQLNVGLAKVAEDNAAIGVAQAVLDKAKKNVGYCTITSPVKGEIIDRRVNIGQTVVSSLSAPSLFLIAKDLNRVQVWASVNEADVANIQPGQKVTFTIDAYPGRVFEGSVNKVRFNATMNQNVVTYTVEIGTDNTDGALTPYAVRARPQATTAPAGKGPAANSPAANSLDGKPLPYMTANVLFEISRRENVLQVPNAALRWMPADAELVVPEAREKFAARLERRAVAEGAGGSGGGGGGQGGQRSSGAGGAGAGGGGRAGGGGQGPKDHGTLWVQEGALFRPIRVKLGATDGINTEISGDDLKEGDLVVTGEIHSDAAAGEQTTNPFAPPSFRRK